jgi:hypothetical protein
MTIKKLLLTTSLLLITMLFTNQSFALEIKSREELKIDDAMSEESNIYSRPEKIYITQVSSVNRELTNNPKAWIRALYYYSITRLNLNDIPYNYLIDSSGNIYEGAKGGPGINPGLQGGENVVLVGILDRNTTLTPRVSSSLKKFVESLSYRYGIKEGSWDYVDLKIVRSENEISYLIAEQSKGTLRDAVAQSLDSVKWSEKENLDYKASIVEVSYSEEVEIGSELEVVVKVKNENDFTWFADSDYIYVSTADSKESPYAVNSVWHSFSRASHIEDKFVKAGDTVEVQFVMAAKSKPGKYEQSFILSKASDIVVKGSEFKVEFNIVSGDKKIVEVNSPQYGFVNIRECRWGSCKKIDIANHGDVFIMSKKEEGWYEIYYKGENKGWVAPQYIREL